MKKVEKKEESLREFTELLLAEGKQAELLRAATDKEYLKTLYKEYNITP